MKADITDPNIINPAIFHGLKTYEDNTGFYLLSSNIEIITIQEENHHRYNINNIKDQDLLSITKLRSAKSLESIKTPTNALDLHPISKNTRYRSKSCSELNIKGVRTPEKY